MNRLALLAAMALLGIGLSLAQNAQNMKPSSDPSNSSNPSAQPQSSASTPDAGKPNTGAARHHRANQDDQSQSPVPDATVDDQPSSTTSNPGAADQSNTQPSRSTMGTTGSTPAASEPPPQPQTGPQSTPPPDQQPNPSSQPNAARPHAWVQQTPAARAVATHTPDPGTCMNPAALQTSADGTSVAPPPCR